MKRKLFTLLFTFLVTFLANAKQVVFDFSNPMSMGVTSPESGQGTNITAPITLDGVTMTGTKGTLDFRFFNSNGVITLRVYKSGGTVTFVANENIECVTFEGKTIDFAEMTGMTWAGTPGKSITFTANSNCTLSKATIYIGEKPNIRVVDTVSVSQARTLIETNDTLDHFIKGIVASQPFKKNNTKFSGHVNFYMVDDLAATDSLLACQVYAGQQLNASQLELVRWASLEAAWEELRIGDTILVYANALNLNATNIYQIESGFYDSKLGANPNPPAIDYPAYDTITVAEALGIAKQLTPEVGKSLSTDKWYVVGGYVTSVRDAETKTYYMADEMGVYAEFQAYKCYKIDATVNEGDYVFVRGQIVTYNGGYNNTYEIYCGTLEHAKQYIVKTDIMPKNTGVVNCQISRKIIQYATLTASPKNGYHFVCWNDSVTDNPRTIKLTQDTTITAIFAPNIYTLNMNCDSTRGDVNIPHGEFEYMTSLEISATAKYGYHFSHWSDKNTQNPRVITIQGDVTLEAIFEPNTYTVSAAYNLGGTITGTGSYAYRSVCTVEAYPIENYHFVIWSDGIKANPRSIVVTQDIVLDAIFALDTTGYCGKDFALTWAYNASTKTLTIGGNGSFDEHIKCGLEAKQNMKNLVIDEGVTAIGDSAFAGCPNLTNIQLPTSLKTIGDKAFVNCIDLTSIYNYRKNPCLVSANAFEGVNKFDCTLYVLAGSVAMYKSEGSNWIDFYYIEPIGSVPVTEPVTDVETKPADNNVTITWPIITGTNTYTIEIFKGGVVVCTLIFSADGQLTGIAFAPGRDGGYQAPAATFTENGGMRFTVTGLESGTNYQLKVTAKDASNQEVETYSSEFKTTSNKEVATGLDQVSDGIKVQKVLRDGQILILRGDKTYTITGQEVR